MTRRIPLDIMAGDKQAARQFLHEAGFTDAGGNWLPHFQPLEEDNP